MTDNTESTAESSRIARRTLLSSLSAGAVALAGCSSNSPSTTTDSQQPSQTEQGTQSITTGGNSVFADVQIGTTDLQVELADAESVSRVNLIDPDGELHSRTGVSTGATQVSLRLSDDWGFSSGGYTPGTYRLVAVDGENSVEEIDLEIRPDVSITGIRWAKNHPEMTYQGEDPPSYFAQVLMENTGTGPAFVEELQFEDTPLDVTTIRDVSQQILRLVPPGATVGQMTSRVFKTYSGSQYLDCDAHDEITFTISASLRVSQETPSYSRRVRYETDENGSCILSLVESSGNSDGTSEDGGA
ncbi:hypothetical protein [Haloarchaeobius litoreus]|uniref:Tat (Twin-arginine translocation) pathway signal sequence n=1 Tax=Haloarchaeobius litoreus TaxID=755306 RepID=A0ABD6DPT6_9EURY|nr:hypothetical protein [Haloarchaeobius litoreus]